MKLFLLLLSFIWSNPMDNQALSTIGLHEQIIQTYEDGSLLEVHFFDVSGHELQIKQKRYYYQNGSIKSIGYYLMDKKIIWKYYDEENNIIQEKTWEINWNIVKADEASVILASISTTQMLYLLLQLKT